ncbi:MAG: hypothetical protein JJ916_03255 [Phycisphaerales bacterium]|nr:hypothetical protein [Phycisphaerales bacterium]
MGMIKRADLERFTRDAYVMDLGDLEKRGKLLIESANKKAFEIVRDAKQERDRLIGSASEQGHAEGHDAGYQEGFEKGRQEGIEQARQEHAEVLEQLIAMWGDQLGVFEQRRDEMLESSRVQVVELAAAIASRVVRRTIELDPSIVTTEIESVLSAVTEPTRLVIAVHPDDAELARKELPSLIERFAHCEHAQITTDPSLPRGSCVAKTPGGGRLDASVSTQLNRIIDALLPKGQNRGQVLGLPVDEAHDDDSSAQQEDAA